MKQEVPQAIRSQYVIQAIDALFDRPIFTSTDFMARSKIPEDRTRRILKTLKDEGFLLAISGRERAGERAFSYSRT